MAPRASALITPAEKSLVITRVFNAPRALVFKAWTDPKHMAEWWGPRDFTNPLCEMDVRPGGAIRIDMRAPNGNIHTMTGEFNEIVEPERLVMTTRAFPDENGGFGIEVLNMATFEEKDGKTTLTLNVRVLKSAPRVAPALAGMEEGWTQSLEKLSHLVADIAAMTVAPIIIVTRIFDAPRELVWQAWTDPKHMAAWWGPHGYVNEVVELDVRPGGLWRVVQVAPGGNRYVFKGTYVEVIKPERLVNTFGVEGMYEGKTILDSHTFKEQFGRTRYTGVSRFDSMADRDLALQRMGEGADQAFERLDAYLKSI